MDSTELIDAINTFSKLRVEYRNLKYSLGKVISRYLMLVNDLDSYHVDICGLGYVDDPCYTHYRFFHSVMLNDGQVEVEYEDINNNYCYVTIPFKYLIDMSPLVTSLNKAKELRARLEEEAGIEKKIELERERYERYLELKEIYEPN